MQKALLKIIALTALAAAFAAPGAAAASTPAGHERVIVSLAVAEPTAATIAGTTDQLLASLPAGEYTLLNRFTAVPNVNLTVSAAGRAALEASALVAAIERDGTVRAAAKRKCKTYTTSTGTKIRICKRRTR